MVKRVPASIGSMAPKIKRHTGPANSFEGSLVEEYKRQMRHSNEVNELIDALKSYDNDYKKGY